MTGRPDFEEAPNFEGALAELLPGPPPTNFAERALHLACRRQRRAYAVTAVATVMLLALVALPAIIIHNRGLGQPAGAQADAASLRYSVLSFSTVTPATGAVTYFGWNADTQLYTSSAYELHPSPTGARAVVVDQVRARFAIAPWTTALSGINLSWLPFSLLPSGAPLTMNKRETGALSVLFSWATDGASLFAVRYVPGSNAVRTITAIDPLTERMDDIPVPASLDTASRYLDFAGIAGNELLFWTSDARGWITYRFVDRQGAVTRTLSLQGTAPVPPVASVAGIHNPVSPAGDYLLPAEHGSCIDVSTGAQVGRPRLDNGRVVGWYDETSYLVLSQGTRRTTLSQVDIAGHTLRDVPLGRLSLLHVVDVTLVQLTPATQGAIAI
jgi:hypothetical protein